MGRVRIALRRHGRLRAIEALVIAFGWSLTSAVGAQMPAPVGVVRLTTLVDTQPMPAPPQGVSDDNMLGRMALGVVGSVGGALMGAVLGAGTVMGCHGEECVLNGAVPGAMVGSVLVSLLTASEPSFSSACQSNERLVSAAKGAIEAALIGGVVGAPKGFGGAVLGAFGGMSVGGGVGAAICKPKAH